MQTRCLDDVTAAACRPANGVQTAPVSSRQAAGSVRRSVSQVAAPRNVLDPRDNVVIAQWIASPVGPLFAGVTGGTLVWLSFSESGSSSNDQAVAARAPGRTVVQGDAPLLDQLRRELAEYFAGRRRDFTVPCHAGGTEFQRRVWSGLREIPYGRTMSYAELACRVGSPRACRAVGLANGRNPLVIVVPCHRVVNSDGGLGGFSGGLDRKRMLLDLERRTLRGPE